MSIQTTIETIVAQLKTDSGIPQVDSISHDDYFPVVTNNVCVIFPPHGNKTSQEVSGQNFDCMVANHTVVAQVWVKYVRGNESSNMSTIRTVGNELIKKIVQKEGPSTYYVPTNRSFEFAIDSSLATDETQLPWFRAELEIPIVEFLDYS